MRDVRMMFDSMRGDDGERQRGAGLVVGATLFQVWPPTAYTNHDGRPIVRHVLVEPDVCVLVDPDADPGDVAAELEALAVDVRAHFDDVHAKVQAEPMANFWLRSRRSVGTYGDETGDAAHLRHLALEGVPLPTPELLPELEDEPEPIYTLTSIERAAALEKLAKLEALARDHEDSAERQRLAGALDDMPARALRVWLESNQGDEVPGWVLDAHDQLRSTKESARQRNHSS